jgi:hypothetical protein
MKDIFELADTQSSDVTAITPKVISATIEEIRRGKRVIAQFYKENTDLISSGGTEVEFPAKGSGVVITTNMSAGNTITTGNMEYTATTIAVKKHGVGVGFYGEAIRQTKRDIIRDAILEAGEVFADAMDTIALEAMFPKVTITAGSASTVDTASTLVIGIQSTIGNISSLVTNTTMSAVVFGGAGTVVAWYIPTTAGGRKTSATGASLSAKDLFNTRVEIEGYNFKPDVVIINPLRMSEILYDPATKFVEAWTQRGGGPAYTGEIGQIWDMKVIVSTKAPIYGAIVLDSKSLGYEVRRMDLELKRDDITGLKTDMLYFYGFTETNFGVVNKRAYGAVALTGTFATPTVNPTK